MADDGIAFSESAPDWVVRHARAGDELIGTVIDAARFNPLRWPGSVLGLLRSMGPAPLSEYQLVWSGDLPELGRYLADVLIPSLPGQPPSWLRGSLGEVFFHRSEELAPEGDDPDGRFAAEEWFFINGILTNRYVARMNARYLVQLFGRPMRVLWNSTDGALVDLVECGVEKLGAIGEDVTQAFHPLLESLVDPGHRRVVVCCHSQGTLIMAVVLRLLRGVYLRSLGGEAGSLTDADRAELQARAAAEGIRVDPDRLTAIGPEHLRKLEVYCFANCATDMDYVDPDLALPYIESYGNEKDLVARLGMLAPNAQARRIRIVGPRFARSGAWGHLLNAHYLNAERGAYKLIPGSAPEGTEPRLLRYRDGAEALAA